MSLFAIFALPIHSILYYFVLYQYVVPRENKKKQLILCMVASVCLQLMVRICFLTDIEWIRTYNIAKLLTVFMVALFVFWGGSLVYGGWEKMGLMLIITEVVVSIYQRGYWQIWGMFTSASMDDVLYHAGTMVLDLPTGIELIILTGIFIIFIFPAKKVKKYPIRPLKLVRVAVVAYIIMGSMPFFSKVGFDDGQYVPMFLFLLAFIIILFILAILIINAEDREKHYLISLRQNALTEQMNVIRSQKQKVRRFNHDILKHIDNMSFLLQENSSLQNDTSFLQYQAELKQYENVFQHSASCESEEFNVSMTQIDQYCADHKISSVIHLKRMHFPAWEREDQMLFGILLYHIFMLLEKNGITGITLSGDRLQGQNILRMEMNLLEASTLQAKKLDLTKDYLEDIDLVLRKYQGSSSFQETDSKMTFAFLWTDQIDRKNQKEG